MLTELTFAILKYGFLVLLWIFVACTVRSLYRDIETLSPRKSRAHRRKERAARKAVESPAPVAAAAPSASAATNAKPTLLVIIDGPLAGSSVPLAGNTITLGRSASNTVVLDDADTARLHKWFHALPLPEPGPTPEHLLEVRGLGFGYTKGQSTLHDISFSIGKGEMVSIVGRNGAGKSTLAKLICGFETPEQGQVLLNGRDLAQDNIRRRAQHIGYVMQNPNQMISKTMIFEEVALALQGSDMTQEQICQRVEDTLKVCGLYPFRNWPISALSFGQKKRVTIASVLVQQPELIILDEPTAGQDFRHYTDIMEFLRGLNEQGVTVVMITHDMHLMLEYTPRALVFCDGQLIADRSAAAVLCDPELIEQAALKETSLFTLANRCGIAPAEDFVERFIHEDREVRTHGC